MGLFDKVKNLFTDEEEIPVTREVKYSEKKSEEKINPVKKEEKVSKKEVISEIKDEKQEEEKFVFFDDEDFEDIKQKEFPIEKPVVINKIHQPYGMTSKAYGSIGKPKPEEKKRFVPSLIISPIYGVLDKDYKKEELKPVNVNLRTRNKDLTIDDVREKAFSSLEDDLKNNLFNEEVIVEEEVIIEDELNMFDDDMDIIISEETTTPIKTDSLYDDVLEEDTLYLSKKLEEQQKKLDEINELIKNESFGTNLKKEISDLKDELSDTKKTVKKNKKLIKEVKEEVDENEEAIDTIEEKIEPIEEDFDLLDNEEDTKKTDIDDAFNETIESIKTKDDMSESELFNLIDSMYEGDE